MGAVRRAPWAFLAWAEVPERRRALDVAGLLLAGGSMAAGPARAEQPAVQVAATAVVAVSHVSPIPGGGSRAELRAEQPVLMVRAGALAERLGLDFTLNFEGLSIPNGVLGLGVWGEGYVDRRHPHTYLHEAMVSLTEQVNDRVAVGVAAGKGFVPFGTDDPMNRPALRFPVNHHLSQILERAVVLTGGRAGPVAVEGAAFNGDEPERPGQWPNVPERFADSWAARVTAWPVAGVEAQVSHASVASPEHRGGAGPRQEKWSASVRFEGPARASRVYGLLEWARTEDADGFFVFTTVLGETQVAWAGQRLYARWERTSRPEELRTPDPFRSVRPHLDDAILGKSRWSVYTAGYAVAIRPLRWLTMEPIAEVALARAADLGGVFRVEDLYGRRTFASLTAGVRVRHGTAHRMGRYGVLRDTRKPQSPGHGH